jgi:hypothetical protein
MKPEAYRDAVEACYRCADACDRCAAACLLEDDVKAMARCIALDVDCADLCRLAAAMMARDSEHAVPVARLCAELCETCGEECAGHDMDHCRACAEACRGCAKACRAISEQQ